MGEKRTHANEGPGSTKNVYSEFYRISELFKTAFAKILQQYDAFEDERYFRNVVRRTRMVFDALRVLSTTEEEKRLDGVGMVKRLRGDLRVSSIMKDRDLRLNHNKRIVGSILGVYIGDLFFFRIEEHGVGVGFST